MDTAGMSSLRPFVPSSLLTRHVLFAFSEEKCSLKCEVKLYRDDLGNIISARHISVKSGFGVPFALIRLFHAPDTNNGPCESDWNNCP
jgi:hypothetical protein